MAEPFCTIDWFWEGHREIRVSNTAAMNSRDNPDRLCVALTDMAMGVTSVDELQAGLDGIAAGAGLRVGFFRSKRSPGSAAADDICGDPPRITLALPLSRANLAGQGWFV
jgi:hypothetical protein